MGKKIGIIMVAIALIAGPARGSAQETAETRRMPVLGRVNTFSGDTSASMLVRLPADVPITNERDLRGRFEGGGRIIAYVLVKEGWDGPSRRRPMIVGQRVGQCAEVGCASQSLVGGGVTAWGVKRDGAWEMPAGVYRLYLVADGAPVEMKLTIASLEGETTLTPKGPARAEIVSLTPGVHEMVDLNDYSAGTTAPFRGEGYSSIATWRKGEVKVAGAYGICAYEDEPPRADAAIAYLPVVCPETFRDANVYAAPIRDYAGGFEAFINHVPAALGMWYASAAVVRDYGATVLWLET